MSEILIPSTKVEELSRALWVLAMPPQVRRAGDFTDSLFRWITDLENVQHLVVMDDLSIRVHEAAELGEIEGILQPWVNEGLLPADTITQLKGFIESKRGEWLVIYQAFPALFKLKDAGNPTGLGRTREQMIQENRLANPTLP